MTITTTEIDVAAVIQEPAHPHATLLARLLQKPLKRTSHQAFKKGKFYGLDAHTTVKLSHEIIKRPCASAKHHGETRFEVVDNKAMFKRSDGLGAVTQSLATLTLSAAPTPIVNEGAAASSVSAPSSTESSLIAKNKKRIIKFVTTAIDDLEATRKEVGYTHTSGDIQHAPDRIEKRGFKNPVMTDDDFNGVTYALVMHKLEGEDLYNLLKRKPQLSYRRSLELIIAVLKAIKAQVTDRNLVHHDLKPENILVRMPENENDPIDVSIIDFGNAKNKTDKGTDRGTPGYESRESVRGEMTTEKSDVSSAAFIISDILSKLGSNKKSRKMGKYYQAGFFVPSEDTRVQKLIPCSHPQKINEILAKMQKCELYHRSDFAEVIQQFEALLDELPLPAASSEMVMPIINAAMIGATALSTHSAATVDELEVDRLKDIVENDFANDVIGLWGGANVNLHGEVAGPAKLAEGIAKMRETLNNADMPASEKLKECSERAEKALKKNFFLRFFRTETVNQLYVDVLREFPPTTAPVIRK